MKRRLFFFAAAGLVVAFLASWAAYTSTHTRLTRWERYWLYHDHDKLTAALREHRKATGNYPEQLTQIKLPSNFEIDVDGQGNPLDPWRTPYVYERAGDSYVLQSLGSDGEFGGWGTKAEITFPTAPDARPPTASMNYWEFMIDEPTSATAGTSALAGLCTFLIGAISALRNKDNEQPIAEFVIAAFWLSIASLFVGGLLAIWHVPIYEHH
jgi:hypothetical protein